MNNVIIRGSKPDEKPPLELWLEGFNDSIMLCGSIVGKRDPYNLLRLSKHGAIIRCTNIPKEFEDYGLDLNQKGAIQLEGEENQKGAGH